MAAAPVAGPPWRRRTAGHRPRQERRRQHPHRSAPAPGANIVEAARLAFVDAGQDPELIPQTPAVLGLAGANVGTYRQQLEAILPFSAKPRRDRCGIALEGAVGSGDGAMAILGTGTAYMARKKARSRADRRLGFPVGDQGSGARIGRDLLRADAARP